ncbi:hypothetical protein Sjap_012978 [Stephania japonica]|uniref:Non-specific lipid-transfer protein n=1 Tax=Stephania japonica TaxID=461633 RepID=A0AAP0IZI9_9MAGN
MKKVSCVSVTVTVTLMLLLLLPYSSEATLTCTDVFKNLQPCLNYLVNGYGKPPPACCAGASKLATAASTPADKKTACTCIKTASQNIKLNAAAAQALPGNCGISLPVTVSPTVDCSKIENNATCVVPTMQSVV